MTYAGGDIDLAAAAFESVAKAASERSSHSISSHDAALTLSSSLYDRMRMTFAEAARVSAKLRADRIASRTIAGLDGLSKENRPFRSTLPNCSKTQARKIESAVGSDTSCSAAGLPHAHITATPTDALPGAAMSSGQNGVSRKGGIPHGRVNADYIFVTFAAEKSPRDEQRRLNRLLPGCAASPGPDAPRSRARGAPIPAYTAAYKAGRSIEKPEATNEHARKRLRPH